MLYKVDAVEHIYYIQIIIENFQDYSNFYT